MVRFRFTSKGFPTTSTGSGLIQKAMVVALVLLFANVKPVNGDGDGGLPCTLTLKDGSKYVQENINNVNGVTFSTAGTLTCEAVGPLDSGPCQDATISNCLSVVCNNNACQNADLSTRIGGVQCGAGACSSAELPDLCVVTYPDGSAYIGAAIEGITGLEYDASTSSLTCHTGCDGLTVSGCSSVASTSVCTLFQPDSSHHFDGTAYFGSALVTLDGIEFDADTNTLTCNLQYQYQSGPCQTATVSGCSQLICEDHACGGAIITAVPSIECSGNSACEGATIAELPNDTLVKCVGASSCLNSEITAADSSSGTRVICDGVYACGYNDRENITPINVDCVECRSDHACPKDKSSGCHFHGEKCQQGPQGSCPCSLTTSTGEIYLEQDINTLTDVSYHARTNSILCEGQLNGLCRDGTIMACHTVECSTRACKGTTVWKPNDLDCVGKWACKEAVLKKLPSGATASCNGERACVDAVFTTEEGSGVTVDCIDTESQACLRATLDNSAL
ncbi:expressed unknown protein [Seminavis robusta]|uniref:Uncharacterized protein n=1 Tax=Seminavis robusta TaxID=568900 RepID=A0A9N8EFL5_9STRA|nr:expressed unknown protein [Seminavis robusta]|eukprot:Sro1082_g239231.1  (506) ;mRNA; r:28845-30362